MGNQYSQTSDIAKLTKPFGVASYGYVAAAAAIDTAHLVGKAATSTLTPHMNKIVPRYVDSTK